MPSNITGWLSFLLVPVIPATVTMLFLSVWYFVAGGHNQLLQPTAFVTGVPPANG